MKSLVVSRHDSFATLERVLPATPANASPRFALDWKI
jgi:hypothetical protein